MTANEYTNQATAMLLDQIPRHVKGGVRVWRQNTGKGYGVSAVRASVEAGKIVGRPISFGVVGGGDISGIGVLGVRIEIEVKSPDDVVSEEQIQFRRMIDLHGGIYLICKGERLNEEDLRIRVRQTIRELKNRFKGLGFPEPEDME